MTSEHHAEQAALHKLIADTAADLSQAEPFWTAGCLATALIAKGVTTSSAFAAREADLVGALEAYRAAVQWVAADSWDGCSDCIEILKCAAAADLDYGLSPDAHAAALAKLRALKTREASHG